MSVRDIAFLIISLLIAPVQAADKANFTSGLTVRSPTDFFLIPDRLVHLTWHATTVAGSQLRFVVRDYQGTVVHSNVAAVTQAGLVTADVKLSTGYYDLTFPDNGETYGLVVAPEMKATDEFFCIDAGLTWLEQRPPVREAMISILQRCGIAAARERLSWGALDHTSLRGDWETSQHDESLRRIYASHGIKLLEMMYGDGFKIDSKELYPQKLGPAAESWGRIAKRWKDIWIGNEIWNEPDVLREPADQYVPLVKMAAYLHDQGGITSPIVSGVFTGSAPSAYHDACAANGMLDCSDAVSFHTYEPPSDLTSLVEKYRAWLDRNGKQTMPLWLTEAGKAWPLGRRPSLIDDQASGANVCALAIEARACGIARFFPFVFTHYEEGGDRNFGMMSVDLTPLRAMAAYANLVRQLSGKIYIGDILNIPGTRSVHVFGDGEHQLIVIYSKVIDPLNKVQLGFSVHSAEGVDGRRLDIGADGSIPTPDGITFVSATRDQIEMKLRTDTPAFRLHLISEQPPPARPRSCPVALQNIVDRSACQLSPRRYLLKQVSAGSLNITVRAQNLGDHSQNAILWLTLPGSNTRIRPVQLDLAALGSSDSTWTVDARKCLDVTEARIIRVEGQLSGGEKIGTLAIPYMMEGSLEAHLRNNSYKVVLPIADLSQWKSNIAKHAVLTLTNPSEGGWRLDATFPEHAGRSAYPAGRWVYPILTLSEPIDADRTRGILIRARILQHATNVAILLRESAGKPGFWANEIFPADGDWHVAYIPFEEFIPEDGNPDGQNAIFKANQFKIMQLGFGSTTTTNAMELSNLLFVGRTKMSN